MRFSDHILAASAQFHGVTIGQIKATGREAPLPAARKFFAYLCHKETGLRKSEIGRVMRRDHSSVFSAIEAIENTMSDSLQMQLDMVLEVAINRMNFSTMQAVSRHQANT